MLAVGESVSFMVGRAVGCGDSVVGTEDILGIDDGATRKKSIGSFIRSTAHHIKPRMQLSNEYRNLIFSVSGESYEVKYLLPPVTSSILAVSGLSTNES